MSIDNLVRELGVSQTPIREALSRLEALGLVVKTHLIGYSAADQMDRERLQQLYELRLLLEPFAAGRAALAMSGEAIAALEAADREMHKKRHEDARIAYGRFAQNDGTLAPSHACAPVPAVFSFPRDGGCQRGTRFDCFRHQTKGCRRGGAGHARPYRTLARTVHDDLHGGIMAQPDDPGTPFRKA
jgi:hypothetical protein